MALALLTIGTATTRIDLLADRNGWRLSDWRPAATDHDTTYAESALADGRQPVASRDLNVIESFDLKLRANSQDDAAVHTQNLRRMLRDALSYWTSSNPALEPVYLAARASCETNTRYALVYDGRLPTDDNYYGQPFIQLGAGSGAVMDAMTLVVERGPWLEEEPGTPTCVQVSGEQEWAQTQTTVTASPAASGDDGWAYNNGASWTIAGAVVPLGYYLTDPALAGIRFMNLNVPQGAQILDAYVTFTAVTSLSNEDCNVRIIGEDTDSAAIFSTWGDFSARLLGSGTSAQVIWPKIGAWTAANTYDTPSLVPIIQEIVNRAGWVANNELALFFIDNNSDTAVYRDGASWDHPTAAAPQLTVTYYTGADFGRDETCDDEVYIANKQNVAQITHAYWYDASGPSWSPANLIGTATPFDLLPNPVANGDMLYIGIETALVDAGPFSNVVFDIDVAAVYGGAATLDWEYWNGAWVALTVQENTGPPTQPFTYEGVNSIHFEQPTDWATLAAAPAVGVTGFWIRAVAAIGGGDSISTPEQGRRDIYTIDWPRVEIAADQVTGDMPALAEVFLSNQSGGLGTLSLWSTRAILGLRSVDRGAEFTPFINLSSEQNPAGITVSGVNSGTIDATVRAPTGWALFVDGATAMLAQGIVTMTNTIGYQYFGKYRVFVRGWQVTGGTVGNVAVKVQAFNGHTFAYTRTGYFTALNEYQVIDLGLLTIPSGMYPSSDTMTGGLRLSVYASATNAADDAYFTEMILMPVDEWAGDFLATGDVIVRNQTTLTYGSTYLDVDSITYPKANLRASIRDAGLDTMTGIWEPRCAGPAILLNGKQQRLWALFTRRTATSAIEYAEPEICHRVQVWRMARYDTLRGAG